MPGIEAPGRPEVDEAEGAVVEQQDVARVRVGMEVAVREHVSGHRVHQAVGQLDLIQTELRDPAPVGHAHALEALLHKHPWAQKLLVHEGDADARLRSGRGGQVDGVRGFEGKVELLAQVVREVLGDRRHAELSALRRPSLHGSSQVKHRGRVACHRLVDRRTLHLHHHRLPGLQTRRVGLRDRGGPDRIPVELGEHPIDGCPQLLLQLRLHDLPGERLDRALEAAQLEPQRLREQILPSGRDLAHLHEHDAALLERGAEGHVDGDARCRPATTHPRKRQAVCDGRCR